MATPRFALGLLAALAWLAPASATPANKAALIDYLDPLRRRDDSAALLCDLAEGLPVAPTPA